MTLIEKLDTLRSFGGPAVTHGLPDDQILSFAAEDPRLEQAVDSALGQFGCLKEEFPELLAKSEADQIADIQSGYVNFYPDDAVNPYVALAGKGPWLVTLKGAVLYECGGYGMLGFGHAPDGPLGAMNRDHVMANIMTPSVSQKRFKEALDREIGHTRGGNPFASLLCLNSGSEAVTLAARIADINAKLHTDPDGRYAGGSIRRLGLKGAFHGRTDRPGRFSDSTRKSYEQHLASYRDDDILLTVTPNDVEELEQAFAGAEARGEFIEAMFIEPVMGEGNPGMAVTPEFYARARTLTLEHGTLLLVDSIQAGLRAQGVLSIVDYPGFEKLDPPDMETYSKAINAGQYPLSVLAVTERAEALYRKGVYGNTMSTNPRAMDVAVAVLNALTPEMRQNVRDRGAEMVAKLQALADELGGAITKVQGTGLLISAELDPERFKSYGTDSSEEYMRMHGVNVVHGGANALRYTPGFTLTSAEVDLMVDATRQALVHGPQKAASEAA
ncbi:MAG: aminotransferase class III-fold pyridoxal phosphate-dependent enzyme [Xanthomonadales bacterium]|jgi:acetylornithine/succinyldiaminopimelate/putrescine aminotransferase|nr:aminotransferase class III-fold pyridoxal phosphate-dependent enzyme [Xanthomonadales bacterium]